MEKYQDESLDFKTRAKDLVAHMTIEECASQMRYEAAKIERLGIPYFNWWNEALHGTARSGMATVFPQAIGMAATFDDELIEKVADVASTEGRAKYNTYQKYEEYGIYKGITFWTPNVNIFRDPRWGRGQETYGEDPYLTSRMGAAFVRGLQGKDEKYLKTAACAKHFAVHSGPEKIRHEFDAQASKKDMAETYLPAFKALVDEKVEGVMGAYNRTNGDPCCAHPYLMGELLRGKWHFDGYFTSDCWAIADFHLYHHVTDTPQESAALAVKNGCDLNCGKMYGYILQALQEGLITEEEIRTCCEHLMTTRMRLGMFDEKTPWDDLGYDDVDTPQSRALNLDVARKTMVLLKNDGVLPLKKEGLKRIAVIGPNADSVTALNGNYHGTANEYVTVLEAVRQAVPDVRVEYSRGCHLYKDNLEDPGYVGDGFAEVKALTDRADAVILVVGMDETIEGEEMGNGDFTGDKKDLLLPEVQRKLVRVVCERNTPVILVNMTGSAIDFAEGMQADAIIQAWYPGALGGRAVSDLIFGEYSPSGKLPVTFYKNDNHLPEFTDYSMDNRTYKFFKETPLYPFGYGLGYTSFAYSDMKADCEHIKAGDSVSVSVKVKNTGNVESDEIVQCYIRDEEASVRVPVHKLCQMKRVHLLPGEETEVEFTVDGKQFAVIGDDGEAFYESGSYTLFAGGSQPDEYSESLTGSKCVSVKVSLVQE